MSIQIRFVLGAFAIAGLSACYGPDSGCVADYAEMRAAATSHTPFRGSVMSAIRQDNSKVWEKFPDCCVVRKYDQKKGRLLDDPYFTVGPVNEQAYYYVQIPFRYAGDDTFDEDGHRYLEPYLVEFDRCGSKVYSDFPWGD